jgi:hypothetical protein
MRGPLDVTTRHVLVRTFALAAVATTGVLVPAGLAQGVTERASVTADASQAQGDSDQVSVSGDGRFVAFRSAATRTA